MKNLGAKVPGKGSFRGKTDKKVGRPFGPIKPDVRRVPQVRVSRPVFHFVKYLATKYASARIFLQHLKPRSGTAKAIAILILFMAATAHASDTRTLANVEVGTASGLGYQLPHILAGMSLEKPLGTHWEAQGTVSWSPDSKYITHDGKSAQMGAALLFWPIQRVAIVGGAGYTRLWTNEFQKAAFSPSAGAVLRDRWYGAPGRFDIRYVFPTGCQWGSTCVIQSSRTNGIEGFQEFQLWPHWRIGVRGAWWHFAEQSNPLDRAAGRAWHDTGTASMVVRYEFRAANIEESY